MYAGYSQSQFATGSFYDADATCTLGLHIDFSFSNENS